MDEPSRQSWMNRRVSRRGVVRGGALGALGLGLAACSSNSATPTVAPAPTTGAVAATSAPAAPAASATAVVAQPKLGGALKTMVTITERTLDPHMAAGAFGGIGNAICYSNLVAMKWGKDFKPPSYIPGPDLAESWTQPDDVTYLFKLRAGVKWQNIAPVNGRDLVADDVVYSLQRMRDLKYYAAFIAGVTKIEAPDKSTVKLTLDKPNADLILNLAEAVGPQVVAKEQVDKQTDLTALPVIGTGAWIATEFVPGDHIFFKKNPDYFLKGTPYADTFESYRTADASNVLNSFRSGAVNIVGSGMNGQSGEDLIKAVPNSTTFWVNLNRNPSEMVLNLRNDLFKDIRVRQAIGKAIDRKAIIDTVFLGHAALSSGIIMPSADYQIPDAELQTLYKRDVEGAKALLKAAGKETMEFEAVVPNYLQGGYVTMAELIKANLRDVGITINLTVVDTPTITQRQTSFNFAAYIAAGGSGGTPNSFLTARYLSTSAGTSNYAGYSNPDVDKLIDQQFVLSRDPDARKKILLDIQRKIINDAAYINLHEYQQPTMARPELKNFTPPTGTNSHNLFWSTVWIDK